MPKKEVIFTNPARKLNKTLRKQEAYQPEYVRLGLEPGKPAKVSSEDFQYAFNKRKPFVTSSKGPKETNLLPKTTDKKDPLPRKYPPQVKVSSGFNHEHTWRPTAEFYDEETLSVEQVDKEDLSWLDESVSTEELEAQEESEKSASIKFDEVKLENKKASKLPSKTPLPTKVIKEEEYEEEEYEEDEEREIEEDYSVDSVKNNQYCVIVRGETVCISPSLEEIEYTVENILFNSLVEDDISVDDIMVFKRLSVRAGVVVKE